MWAIFGNGRAADVESGSEDRWHVVHQPVRVGRLWVGPPWVAPADDTRVVIDPGRAFGTGSHQTTQLCLAALQEIEPRGRSSTSAAARVFSRSPRRCSDLDQSPGSRRGALDRGDAGERRGQRRVPRRQPRRAGHPPAASRRRRREHLPRISRGSPAAHRMYDPHHLGLSRLGITHAAGFRARRATDARRLGVRRLPRDVTHTISPVATFTVDFLGCKVSHVDAHEVRDALLRDGHTRTPRPTSR